MALSVNNRTIAAKVVHCRSLWSKTRGLMFSTPLHDTALVFHFSRPERWSIHMLFVFFPIDVIYLDGKRRVVDMVEGFRPFSLNYTPKKEASYLVEMEGGMIGKKKISIGDYVRF